MYWQRQRGEGEGAARPRLSLDRRDRGPASSGDGSLGSSAPASPGQSPDLALAAVTNKWSRAAMRSRYTSVAVVLHWLIAAIIIYQLGVGLIMEHIPDRAVRIALVQLHGSLGMTVLVLSLARVIWRLTHTPPPLDPHLALWERISAHAVHLTLYALMIAMPLIGWSILSTSARALKAGVFLFWTSVRVPPLPVLHTFAEPQLDAAHAQFVLLHTIGGYVMIALLLGHVAGAIKHQWQGQPSFRRMWFGVRA